MTGWKFQIIWSTPGTIIICHSRFREGQLTFNDILKLMRFLRCRCTIRMVLIPVEVPELWEASKKETIISTTKETYSEILLELVPLSLIINFESRENLLSDSMTEIISGRECK